MIKLLRFLKPYRIKVVLVIILVGIQAYAELMLPSLMADIVDIGIYTGDTPYILKVGALMLLITLIGSVSTIWKSYLSSKISSAFGRDIRKAVFTKIESFSLAEFDQVSASSLITRTTNDVTQVQRVTIQILNMFLRAPMMAFGGVIMALSRDGQLSIILGVAVVVLSLVIAFVASKAVPLFKSLQIKIDKMNLTLRERLTGIRVIRAFNRTKLEKVRFGTANKDLTDTSIKINRLMAMLMPVMMLLFNLTTVAVIYFGAIRIEAGGMQVGGLMAFIQYATMIMFSLVMFTMMFIMIPRAQVSAKRINEVLEIEPSITDNKDSAVEPIDSSIEFKNVSFGYDGAEMNAICDISFKGNPGETIAIIGGTGSGKSTIINLIPRFYDTLSGEILVGGVEVKKYSLQKLRELISFVPQKAVLFGGTLRENIKVGKDLSDEQVHGAIETAQAKEFTDDFEGDLDYVITQGGTNLSGGQKQRLTIARAIAKDSMVYVFDDSFSALDFKTDSELRKDLKEKTKDAITIIIAQRVSSIKDSDKIIVLDDGSIVGMGKHDELIKDNKTYQEIVYSQLSKEEL